MQSRFMALTVALAAGCAINTTPGTWTVTESDETASTVVVACTSPSSRVLCDINDDIATYEQAVGACGELGFDDAENIATEVERPGGNTFAGTYRLTFACLDED